MTTYYVRAAYCCAFVIFITGLCVENPQSPTPCLHDEQACSDVEFETTEHDVVNLLQKAATVLQRQTEDLQIGSIGYPTEKDKLHLPKKNDKAEAYQHVSEQRDWTKLPMKQDGKVRTYFGTRSVLLSGVFRVVDRAHLQIMVPDVIALICVGLVIIVIGIRSSNGSKKQNMDTWLQENQQSTNQDAKDSDDQEDRFGIATFTGLLLSAADANDFMVLTFLPSYCESRGMSKLQVGALFSALGIVTMLFALVVPYIVTTPKSQQLGVWWGLRCYAATRLPCMALIFLPDSMIFPWLLVVFICVGICFVFIECCATAWAIASVRPEDRTAAMGVMTSGRVLGSLLGPACGGALYNLVGLTIPFAVGFIALILVMEYSKDYFTFSNYDKAFNEQEVHDAKGTEDKGSVLRSPGVVVCELALMVLTGTLLGQLVWMQFNFEDVYHVPPWGYSLITCCVIFVDGVSMMCMVPMIEQALGTYASSLLGIVFFSSSYLLMGPSPWLPFLPTTELWLPISGFLMWAVSSAFPFTIFAALATNIAIGCGWSENDAAVQIASLQSFVSGVGVAVGPMAFMAITQQVGIRATSSYAFVGTLALLGGVWLILVLLNPPVAKSEPVKESTIPQATRTNSCFAGICLPHVRGIH